MSQWKPVMDLLAHMAVDDDLMLRWGIRRHGDVRSAQGQTQLTHQMRQELTLLISAVGERVDSRPRTDGTGTCGVCWRSFNLRQDGRVRAHTPGTTPTAGGPRWCEGSGTAPVKP